jgi:hypothetical protein
MATDLRDGKRWLGLGFRGSWPRPGRQEKNGFAERSVDELADQVGEGAWASPSMTFVGGECKLFWLVFLRTVSALV